MRIAVALYPDFTALDVVGPYELLANWPDAELSFVATTREPVRADSGLTVVPDATFEEVPDPDVLLVGGSSRFLSPLEDQRLLGWVRGAAARARWTCSVCTGATILGAAGVLEGRRATTHWAARSVLEQQGVEVSTDRVVFDGEGLVTAAGVSAGIDMAIALTARVHGELFAQAGQLVIEYDPEPPFDSGSLEKAGPEVLARVGEFLRAAA